MARIVKARTGELSPFQGDDVETLVEEFQKRGGKVSKCRVAVGAPPHVSTGFTQCRLARRETPKR